MTKCLHFFLKNIAIYMVTLLSVLQEHAKVSSNKYLIETNC